MPKSIRYLLLVLAALTMKTARACDLCGCYTPQIEAMSRAEMSAGGPMAATPFYFAVAEQFTHLGTLQFDGEEVANPTGQYLDSSITQLVAGYSFNSRFALQVNLPLIYRSFERPEGFEIDRGTESGVGDISLLGKFVLLRHESGGRASLKFDDPKNPHFETQEADLTVSALLLGGVKFPTGDSSRLEEEFNEVEVPGAPASGIHGHDLTLGSGSYDGIVGAQFSLRYKYFFFQADTQFTVRSEGAHQYEFANDISWSGGPGVYFVRSKETIVGLQFVVSGEHKGVDHFRGEPAEDTGITSVFVGPRVVASHGKLSFEVAAELPVSVDNTALQVVPDYRLRGSFAFRF
ncbi:MAG TPA: hypothetical protein VGW57_07370 [Chthoniobacterales bacterium]|nr:hypothetical protein [Chthoniobacterales bacterium]